MGRTKKVGSTGKFGPRYGRKPKMAFKAIEKKQKANYTCPSCGKKSVKRIAPGIWKCKKCDAKFAGGAYSPW